jgi:hypothetical protein
MKTRTIYQILPIVLVMLAWSVPSAHARVYDPTTGRWLERDPVGTRPMVVAPQSTLRFGSRPVEAMVPRQPVRIGSASYRESGVQPTRQYADGMNLYQYARSTPAVLTDPSGLDTGILSTEFPGERERRTRCQLARACREAVANAVKNAGWLKGLPNCPCRISFFGYWTPGPPATWQQGYENPDPDQWEDPSTKHIKGYHDGAAVCMRSTPVASGAGQQCCYTATGQLITGGSAAGTPDMVSPGKSVIRHWWKDVRPFNWCKKAGLISEYLKGWPPNNGNNCQPLVING